MKICSKELAAIVFGAGAPGGFGGGSSGGFMPFLGNLTGFDIGVTNGVRDDEYRIGDGMGDAKTDHLVPDRVFGVDLSREGRQHNDKYSTIGYSKQAADAELGQDVSKAMGGGILGAVVGLVYQIGVSLGGHEAYNNAQAEARRESSNAGGWNSDGGSSAGASAARGGMGFGGTGSGVGGDGHGGDGGDGGGGDGGGGDGGGDGGGGGW